MPGNGETFSSTPCKVTVLRGRPNGSTSIPETATAAARHPSPPRQPNAVAFSQRRPAACWAPGCANQGAW